MGKINCDRCLMSFRDRPPSHAYALGIERYRCPDCGIAFHEFLDETRQVTIVYQDEKDQSENAKLI